MGTPNLAIGTDGFMQNVGILVSLIMKFSSDVIAVRRNNQWVTAFYRRYYPHCSSALQSPNRVVQLVDYGC